MTLIFLTLTMFLLYAALLIYYRWGWKGLTTFEEEGTKKAAVFISVIVPARNEEKNLPGLLDSLNKQTYPKEKYEIIIVDDHSTDNTPRIVSSFPLSNLRLIHLSDHINGGINSYKKKAIDLAISHSKGDLIVTTDADCLARPRWLETIAAYYQQKRQPSMIVMPVVIERTKSLISIFQALDFMTLQGVTGGAVQIGLHAMCNGANLAYTREAFNTVNGFEGIDTLASGDDMLLMNKIQMHRPGSIAYLKSEDVIVSTAAMSTMRDFLNQRIRWASKTGVYKQKAILFSAGTVYLLNLTLLILLVAGLIDNETNYLSGYTITTLSAWFVLFIAKIIVELFFLLPVAGFFKAQSQLIYFPFLQPLHILYTVLAGGLGMFGSYEWKGRKVK